MERDNTLTDDKSLENIVHWKWFHFLFWFFPHLFFADVKLKIVWIWRRQGKSWHCKMKINFFSHWMRFEKKDLFVRKVAIKARCEKVTVGNLSCKFGRVGFGLLTKVNWKPRFCDNLKKWYKKLSLSFRHCNLRLLNQSD